MVRGRPDDRDDSEVALKPAEVAAAQTDPDVFPTPDTTMSPAGPNWIQIGTEGGFLPAPVVVPNQPITWITDPTRFDVGNVDQHSLLLAPAERADVIVDFSQFAGKTLILYNDAPAAFPARVAGYDYYTGGPDLTPGRRADDAARLRAQHPHDHAGQGRAARRRRPAFNLTDAAEPRSRTTPTARACSSPASTRSSSARPPTTRPTARASSRAADATARPSTEHQVRRVRPDPAAGRRPRSSSTPCKAASAKLSIPLQPKAIHDEMNSASFDEWGRMTANLGLEASRPRR